MISRRTLILLASALSLCAAACSGESLDSADAFAKEKKASYGDLAKERTPAAFNTVLDGLGKVTAATLPHETKSLRKQVGLVRDYVDIFSYAYPLDKKDTWDDIREDLDEGYEAIGAFKDLFDAQGLELAVYDPATKTWSPGVKPEDITYDDPDLVAERLEPVLDWKKHMLESARRARYVDYLSDPSTKKLHEHPLDDQSQFFWAGAGIEPKTSKSGVANMVRLLEGLLERAEDDFGDIDKVKDLTKDEDHEVFHDFRKRVRSIVKLCGYFPEALKAGAKTDAVVALLTELVDRYGSLNDKLLAYDLARDHGDDVDELGDELDDLFDELSDWQKDADIDKSFGDLEKRLQK